MFQSDTEAVAHDTGAYGSTGVVVAGAAAHQAARRLRQLRAAAGAAQRGPLSATGYADGLLRSVTFNVQGFRVAVDPDTGEVRILHSVHAADAGTVINPRQCRGQIEGAVAQALGAALYEEFRIDDDDGTVTTTKLRDYHVPRYGDVPLTEVHLAPHQRQPHRTARRQADERVSVQPGWLPRWPMRSPTRRACASPRCRCDATVSGANFTGRGPTVVESRPQSEVHPIPMSEALPAASGLCYFARSLCRRLEIS